MPKGPAITIFGLSSEGYKIASSLSKAGLPTTLVDESLQVGMVVKEEVFSAIGSIRELMEEESLVGIEPMEEAISKARYLFFAPKIRRVGAEAASIINSRLRTVGMHLSKGTTIFYLLPTGPGGNQANVSLLERLTGLEAGSGFSYIYAPLSPGTTNPLALGFLSKVEGGEREILSKALSRGPRPLPLNLAEMHHLRRIIKRYSLISTEFELCRKSGDPLKWARLADLTAGPNEIYLDAMVGGLFDLRVIAETCRTGEPLLYMLSGILGSVEGYFRHLTDRVRHTLKERALRMGRTRILVVWSIDPYEMRGDRVLTLSNLMEKLRDCVAEVASFSVWPEKKVKQSLPLSMEKTNVVITCSREDFEFVSKFKPIEEFGGHPIIIKANLPAEVVE